MTNTSLDQSPSWEAKRSSAIQKIHRILWEQEVHFRVHKDPLHISILSQMNPLHFPNTIS